MVLPHFFHAENRIMCLVMQKGNKKHFIDVNYLNVFHLPNKIDTLGRSCISEISRKRQEIGQFTNLNFFQLYNL